jgi:hypothetical protein
MYAEGVSFGLSTRPGNRNPSADHKAIHEYLDWIEETQRNLLETRTRLTFIVGVLLTSLLDAQQALREATRETDSDNAAVLTALLEAIEGQIATVRPLIESLGTTDNAKARNSTLTASCSGSRTSKAYR